MLRYALTVTLAAAIWTTPLAPVSAQDKPDPKKPAGAPAKPADPPKTTGTGIKPTDPPKSAAPLVPPKPTDPNIVGSVNGKNILFVDVIARLRRDNPNALKAAVAAVSGPKVADQLFGDKPQASATLSSDEVIALIRDTPNTPVYPTIFQTFQRMLQSEAIMQAAAKENIVVSDQQTQDYINKLLVNLRKQGRIKAGMTDDQFLAEQKLSRAVLVEEFRPQVALNQLKEKDTDYQKQLKSTVEKTIGHSVTSDDYLQARHILILSGNPQTANPADLKTSDAAALAKINKIAAEIKSGKKTFEAAAKESSEDPNSKPLGGELGVFMHGSMLPEFDKVAFAAKPGVMIGPVKSQYGYHLILVEKLGKDLSADERKDALAMQYQRAEQQNQQLTSTFMNNLLEKKVQVASYMTPPPPSGQPGFPPGAQGG